MKFYKYEYLRDTTKKPFNTHLFVEASDGDFYLVDSADQTKLYKSDDEGASWDLITTRTQKIQSCWYDRTNEKIWFVDCDQQANAFDVWNLTLSNDSVTSVGSSSGANAGTVDVMDIFRIGTDTFVINFETRDASTDIFVVWDVDATPFVEKDTEEFPDAIPSKYSRGVVSGNIYYGYNNYYFADPAYLRCSVVKYDNTGPTISILSPLTDAGYDIPDDENQKGCAFDNDDLIYLILKKSADSKNYLWKYSISGTSWIEICEYNIALMLDRNTASGIYEKAFHITNPYIYQIHRAYANLFKIGKTDTGDTLIGISDNFLFVESV